MLQFSDVSSIDRDYWQAIYLRDLVYGSWLPWKELQGSEYRQQFTDNIFRNAFRQFSITGVQK